jgi:hypothetical protein
MRRLVLAIGAISLLACGGDSTGLGASSAVGTWNLVTINGAALPFTAYETSNPPYKLEIMSDQFVASSNGAFSDAITTRENDNGTITTSTTNTPGTWSQSGNTLTVTEASTGFVTTATISGNTVTVSDQGMVSVYHRQ